MGWSMWVAAGLLPVAFFSLLLMAEGFVFVVVVIGGGDDATVDNSCE